MTLRHLLLFVLVCFATPTSAQKIFSVEYSNQADVKVFVVKYPNQADLLVYKVKYENQAGENNGKWFFVKYSNHADKKIYFVDYENQADLKIYFVEYENQAGWKKKEKQALLYWSASQKVTALPIAGRTSIIQVIHLFFIGMTLQLKPQTE